MSTLDLVEKDLEGINLQGMSKTLLIIHKQSREGAFICYKTHVDLHRNSGLQHLVVYIRDLKIYDAAIRRRGFITKDVFIKDNSHE